MCENEKIMSMVIAHHIDLISIMQNMGMVSPEDAEERRREAYGLLRALKEKSLSSVEIGVGDFKQFGDRKPFRSAEDVFKTYTADQVCKLFCDACFGEKDEKMEACDIPQKRGQESGRVEDDIVAVYTEEQVRAIINGSYFGIRHGTLELCEIIPKDFAKPFYVSRKDLREGDGE